MMGIPGTRPRGATDAREAWVDYYHCDATGLVATRPKPPTRRGAGEALALILRAMLCTPVPIQQCPACGRPTPRLLERLSIDSFVNYYRCECGHVWTTSKTDALVVRHITSLPDANSSADSTPQTRRGDVLTTDHAAYLHVCLVVRQRATKPDPDVEA